MQIQNLNSPRKSAHRENKGYLRSTSRKIFKEKEILKLRYIKKKKGAEVLLHIWKLI